jgi:hypothetical protein
MKGQPPKNDNDSQEPGPRACHHVIGLVPIQATGDRCGFSNVVHIDELRRIKVYGGIVFNFCPNCGGKIEAGW